MDKFAESLKQLMRERNLSVKKLAEQTGIARTSLNDWSQGARPTVSEDLVKLAQFFNVSLERLLFGKSVEQSVIEQLVKKSDSEFTEIFSGIYKIRIEKRRE